MRIITEFNPELALRSFEEYKKGNRKLEECIPETLLNNNTYEFLKKGQRNYYIEGEIPLIITKGNNQLSTPIASVIILEVTHFLLDNIPYTRGKYKVNDVFDSEQNIIHFNGFARIK